jgi:hypothetical protein
VAVYSTAAVVVLVDIELPQEHLAAEEARNQL